MLDRPVSVRTVALELSRDLGVIASARSGDAPALEPAWRALVLLVAQALATHDREAWARKQTSLVLDLTLARGGQAGLTRDDAEDLRQRLRQAGAWTSARPRFVKQCRLFLGQRVAWRVAPRDCLQCIGLAGLAGALCLHAVMRLLLLLLMSGLPVARPWRSTWSCRFWWRSNICIRWRLPIAI